MLTRSVEDIVMDGTLRPGSDERRALFKVVTYILLFCRRITNMRGAVAWCRRGVLCSL